MSRAVSDPVTMGALGAAAQLGRVVRGSTGEEPRMIRVIIPDPPRTIDAPTGEHHANQ